MALFKVGWLLTVTIADRYHRGTFVKIDPLTSNQLLINVIVCFSLLVFCRFHLHISSDI